jgi:hypothetical protein
MCGSAGATFQIGIGQYLRIKGFVIVEVLAVKALTVYFIFLIKFIASGSIERSELSDRLGCECATVNEKKDSLGSLRLEKAVDLGHGQEGLPRTRCHGHQHCPLALTAGCLNLFDCLLLIGPYAFDVNENIPQPFKPGRPVILKKLFKGIRRMKVGNLPGNIPFIPHIEMPYHLAVRGIQKRYPVFSPPAGTVKSSFRITLCLFKHILRAYGHLLCFNDSQ